MYKNKLNNKFKFMFGVLKTTNSSFKLESIS